MKVDLPTELWLTVLDTLAFRDLMAISLTCQRLRDLASPRLFRCLSLSTVAESVAYWTRRPANPPNGFFAVPLTPERTEHLLQFYQSAKIAPLVRKFWLTDYRSIYPLRPSIERIFTLLRRLPNLECVGVETSDLDANVMGGIEQLPALTSIFIISCTGSNQELPCLPLRTVQLHGIRTWPFTVQPELLESLHIVQGAFPEVSSLPTLRTLRVDGDAFAIVVECLAFLMCCACPSLESLSLNQTPAWPGPNGGDLNDVHRLKIPPIPHLKTYYGPITLVPLLATSRSLRHVTLWGAPWEVSSSLEHVEGTLQELHTLAPHIVTLTVDVAFLTESALDAACLFLRLERLLFRTTQSEQISLKEFLSILNRLSLPSTIRRLEFHSRFRVYAATGREDIIKLMQANPQLCDLVFQISIGGRTRHVHASRRDATHYGSSSVVSGDKECIDVIWTTPHGGSLGSFDWLAWTV